MYPHITIPGKGLGAFPFLFFPIRITETTPGCGHKTWFNANPGGKSRE